LRHIRACNNCDPSRFIPFRIDGLVVGLMRPAFARRLQPWPEVFSVREQGVDLALTRGTLEERSAPVAEVLAELVAQGVISHLHGEQYVATPGGREDGLLLIDRAAAPYFGIRAFGQHLNGFVRKGDSVELWVGRRSRDRRNYPGKLDNMVAGGLPYGIGMEQNLYKECREEAGISPQLAAEARQVGVLTYNAENEKGLKPDTLFCYDLELPTDFVPRCTDGEVEQFYRWPAEEVLQRVRDSDDYKLNCNLVVIDFLIRHGYLGPEDEEYEALRTGLRPPLIGAGATP
jgi:8-oxo-dGTP pyrophosphatase MutT (NUDIX family)